VVIQSTHFFFSLILLALGYYITWYVENIMKERGYKIRALDLKPLKVLWVIILT
jgi:hypothetical protein